MAAVSEANKFIAMKFKFDGAPPPGERGSKENSKEKKDVNK